jgi:membrane protein required for colicin V production
VLVEIWLGPGTMSEWCPAEACLPMNIVDLLILAVIGLFAVRGLTRGLFLGLVDLLLLGLALLVAAHLTNLVADPLAQRGVPSRFAADAGFVTVFLLALGIGGIAARILLGSLRGLGAGSVLGWLNSLLGMALGVARGVAIVYLSLLAISALPLPPEYRAALAVARLPLPIMTTGLAVVDRGFLWAGIDRATVPFLTVPLPGS